MVVLVAVAGVEVLSLETQVVLLELEVAVR
jgi:hypothetical protein